VAIEIPRGYTGMVKGPRIPYEFFVTQGKGESPHQIHAGSYHKAMADAGIELGNLMSYSSILPKISTEIPFKEGFKRILHGAEVKIIQAAAHVDKTKDEIRKCAGIIFARVYDGKRDIGGLVCESSDKETAEATQQNLRNCLKDLYENRSRHRPKSFKDKGYVLGEPRFLLETVEPKENYGTALVALTFVSHFEEVLAQNAFATKEDLEKALGEPLGIAKEK
jgi:arginine decarboxylase